MIGKKVIIRGDRSGVFFGILAEKNGQEVKLTGSCEMGRRNFVRNHGIDLENDSFTIKEFVELTKDDYCGDVIKKILE